MFIVEQGLLTLLLQKYRHYLYFTVLYNAKSVDIIASIT